MAALLLYSGAERDRIANLFMPLLLSICCCLVIAIEPLLAVSFVVTTMILTAVGSAFLLPIFLMLLIGWGGSSRSAEDSLLLYSLLGCWIANGVALAAAWRYGKTLWEFVPQEKIVYGCLAPFLFVLLMLRSHL